jgi:hypothetical protein
MSGYFYLDEFQLLIHPGHKIVGVLQQCEAWCFLQALLSSTTIADIVV